MRYRKKGEGIEKRIDYTPPPIHAAEIYPQSKSIVRQADDEKFVLNLSQINYIFLILGGGVFWLFFSLHEDMSKELAELKEIVIDNPISDNLSKNFSTFSYYFTKILFAFVEYGSLYIALSSVFGSRKKFIFNRREGTITYPEFGWFRSKTIPFNDACFKMVQLGPYGGKGQDYLAIIRSDGWTRSIIHFEMPHKFFSLYVWYMDKNRPLPPGTAFDPYRERDFLRRQAEGFPAPLYPGRIATPDFDGNAERYQCETILPEPEIPFQT